MNGLEWGALLDAAALLRESAAGFLDRPDCVPESWEIGPEWPREVRERARRLLDVADLLERMAPLDFDLGGDS